MVSFDTFKILKKATQILKNYIDNKVTYGYNVNHLQFFTIFNTDDSPLLLVLNTFNNPIIRIASNINVVEFNIHIGQEVRFGHLYGTHYMKLIDVYHAMQKLIKMGKSGIKARYKQNLEIRNNIVEVSKQMNL